MSRLCVHACAYHDSSTKGARSTRRAKRRDCWRGDIRIYQIVNGIRIQVSRKRKRFSTHDDAYEWAHGEAKKMDDYFTFDPNTEEQI